MNLLDAAYSLSIGPHYLWHSRISGKYGPKAREKTGRVPDRFKGGATAVLGSGDLHYEQPCLWLHAVSVGEVMASTDIVRMFTETNPRWDLRVSTTTATGRGIAEKNWGEEAVFYYPLDFSRMVRRAFDNIRPTMIVLMELEIWPNFLAEAARRGIPVVVANARITERSVKRLSYAPGVTKNMVNVVEEWFAQTDEYAERLRRIGVPDCRIEVTGSVKCDAVPLEIDRDQAGYYRRLFGCGERFHRDGGDLLIVAGSTHPGEEKTLLQSLKSALPQDAPMPRVVLAPRHPERLGEVEGEAGAFGRVVRRSNLSEPAAGLERGTVGGDFVLVDTMGELSKIYAAADLVFVGGTFIRHGGQNFIEPCGLARPTVVGPHLWNFREPAELLRDGCLRVVNTPEELSASFADMIANPAEAAAMGDRARERLLKQRGAAKRMVDRLNVMARMAARKK